jgi:hypothetical protein
MAPIMADPPDKRGPDADDAKKGQLPGKRAQYVPVKRSPLLLMIA